MTPEEAAARNRTAPHGAQARQCRECGRWYTGPGAAGWRLDHEGRAYARTGMCSLRCVDADIVAVRPARADSSSP